MEGIPLADSNLSDESEIPWKQSARQWRAKEGRKEGRKEERKEGMKKSNDSSNEDVLGVEREQLSEMNRAK